MYLPGGGRPAPPVPAHLNTCDSADCLVDDVTRQRLVSESQRAPQTERRSFTVALWLRLASYGYLRGRPRRPCCLYMYGTILYFLF